MDKILLIDDNEDFLKLAKRYLENEDFEVICSDCGEEGMDLAEEKDPDLVLLDLVMPKIDGWEVYRNIKSVKPDMTICFLTSMEKLPGVDKHDVEEYIKKERPFTKEKLVGKVNELLKD